MADARADSVDLVGYSAGGVVAGCGWRTRRRRPSYAAWSRSPPRTTAATSPSSPRLGPGSCTGACRQLAPGSDLLRALNAGDETPAGPLWIAIWTTDDQTVVPPTSGELAGAVDFAVGLPGADRHPRGRAPGPRGRRDDPGGARHHRAGRARRGGVRGPEVPPVGHVLRHEVRPAGGEEDHDVDRLERDLAQHVTPQDRVAEQVDEGQPVPGRQVRLERVAASRPSRIVEATRTASAPRAAPSGDRVTVERKSAIAATSSMHTMA